MPDRIGPLRDVCRCGRGRGFGAATCLARPEQHLPVAVVQLLLVVGEALRAKDAEERHRLERCEKPQALSGAQSGNRSEEHTSELQSLMRISYAVFCLKKKKKKTNHKRQTDNHAQ